LEVTPGASLLIPCKTSRLAVIAASLRLGGGASLPRLDTGAASIDDEDGRLGTSRTDAGAPSRTEGTSRTEDGGVSRTGGGTSRTDGGGASSSETGATWMASAALERGATSRFELRLDGGLGSHGELAVICSRIGGVRSLARGGLADLARQGGVSSQLRSIKSNTLEARNGPLTRDRKSREIRLGPLLTVAKMHWAHGS
jgi:hypothetical protein